MKPSNPILIIAVIIFLSLPVIYLIYKTAGKPPVAKQQPAAANTTVNIGALENAAKTNPTFDNLIALSVAYINNQMPGKSIDPLKQAIKINSKNPVAYNNLAVAYIMLQQYQNGIDACEKALQIDPNFQLAKNNMKWANDERNKILAVIAEQEKTPETARTANFYVAYGLNYFKLGDYDKCITLWNKIIEQNPKNPTAYNNIGTALMMKEQYDKAITMFNKALALDATNQLAKNNLAWAIEEKARAEKQ